MGNGEEYNLDWERESLKDSLYHYERQMELEKEWRQFESTIEATVHLGKPVKNSKFEYGNATLRVKLPRFIQYRNRKLPKLY